MKNTSVSKNTTLNVWGLVIGFAVAIMFGRQAATAEDARFGYRCQECVAVMSGPYGATAGPARVNLGSAGGFVILSKSGITDVYPSAIVGDVGTSPITGAALLLACDEVAGGIHAVDAAGPACSLPDATVLTVGVGDM